MSAAISILQLERDRKTHELESVVLRAKELRAEIKSLEEAIAVLGGATVLSTAPLSTNDSRRSLKFEISDILSDSPGLTPSQIVEKLQLIGRPTDVNTVLGTLSRARKEGLVHKHDRGWFVGTSESNNNDVLFEKDEAPNDVGASENTGDVAERLNAPASEAGGAVPGKSAPVGSNPTVSAPIRRDLLSQASIPVGRSAPKPPWLR